jgi:histidinol-phosphate aminotransferase
MADQEHFDTTRRAIMRSRDALVVALESMGFSVLPSAANFIFVHHPQHDAVELAAGLRQRNIIVRHFRQSRIDQFLRITIGTEAQCATLVAALREIMGLAIS